jgi:hypothetical protein
LRSNEHPEGLQDLSASEKERVRKANLIYDHVSLILQAILNKGGMIAVENPRSSYLWQYKWYRDLAQQQGIFDVDFQHCKWSPLVDSRAKWTRIRTNIGSLLKLAGPCQLEHKHLGWGVKPDGSFATADETAYPLDMCTAIGTSVVQELQSKGFSIPNFSLNENMDAAQPHKKRRAVAARQPRGKNLPAVISEFKEIITCKICDLKKWHKPLRIPVPDLVSINGDGLQTVDQNNALPAFSATTRISKEQLSALPSDSEIIVGVLRTPEEFFEAAKLAKHPLDLDGSIPDEIVCAMEEMFRVPPHEYSKRLISKIGELTKLTKDCELEDREALERMDPLVRTILHKKKLATLDKLAKKTGHPDVDIIADISRGFNLVGVSPHTNLFQHNVVSPTSSIEQLRELSHLNNQAIIRRCGPTDDPEADAKLWEMTKEEIGKGWLLGPFYDLLPVSAMVGYGPGPHLSRRFPLKQATKIRAIDDLKESGVNTAFGCFDKIDFLDGDSLASVVRLVERCLKDSKVDVVLRTKEIRTILVHPGWLKTTKWQGKTFDLSAAYKQLAVNPEQLWSSIVAVWDTDNKAVAILPQVTLPFGAASAVLNFNRVSRLLWRLGCIELSLVWTCFYDDFPTLTVFELRKSTEAAVLLFFKLLGWDVVTDEQKAKPFAELFDALGATYNVERIRTCGSSVENKADRIIKVSAEILAIIAKGSFAKHESEKLQGQIQFMERSIFGRVGKTVRCLFDRNGKTLSLTSEEIAGFNWLNVWLNAVEPRGLSPNWDKPNSLLFCDGACEFVDSENALVTCGAVLIDQVDGCLHYFRMTINKRLTDEWRLEGKQQLVTEAELLPVLIARLLWADRLRNSKLLNFIDSNPALFCSVKGFSGSPNCTNIIKALCLTETTNHIWTWYCRVPSFSNLADMPSRLERFPETWCGLRTVEHFPEQPTSLINGVWSGRFLENSSERGMSSSLVSCI